MKIQNNKDFFSQYFDNTYNNAPSLLDKGNAYIPKDFFELFGLKLYFDDILIICLLFFLYKENVHDEMLFLALILLLLT